MKALTLIGVLVASALLAVAELLYQPTYVGTVPVPLGTLLILGTMPAMIRGAATVGATPLVAGSPLLVWLVVVGVLGLGGPGGDVMLPETWQSLVLIVAALLAGLLTLRRVLDESYAADRAAADSTGTETASART
ncbi:MAG: hypothetical protein OJJ54_22605 [Pseudonocardia sp.]|nr:hypothetical protein [Pseudonocardia sp.]